MKTAPDLANEVASPTFWPELVILRGYNTLQLRKQEPIPNSAPNFRRLPEKLLKTVLMHQNDHHQPKKRKIAFLGFNCDHFKGLYGRVVRGAVFKGGGGGWRNVVVGHCFWRGVRGPQHPDPHRSWPPAGKI